MIKVLEKVTDSLDRRLAFLLQPLEVTLGSPGCSQLPCSARNRGPFPTKTQVYSQQQCIELCP